MIAMVTTIIVEQELIHHLMKVVQILSMFCHKVLRLDHNRNSEMEGKGKGKIVAIFNIYVVSLYSTKQTKQNTR